MAKAADYPVSISNASSSNAKNSKPPQNAESGATKGSTRRAFLGQVAGVAGAAVATAGIAGPLAKTAEATQPPQFANGRGRAIASFNNRVRASQTELEVR
jgi:hypothetical protein